MANVLYNRGKQGFLAGDIDWDTNTINGRMTDSTYVFSQAHLDIADVSGFILTGASPVESGALASKSVTSGVADAADVSFAAVDAGQTVDRLIFFLDTGVDANDLLIVTYDTDTAGDINQATDGGAIAVAFSASGLFSL